MTATNRTFASDNWSGIHPDVLAAIVEANVDHASSYGDDPVTGQGQSAVQGALRRRCGGLHCLQRDRGQRGGAPIAPATVRSGDLRRGSPHQRRRMWRSGDGSWGASSSRWPHRTESSLPTWSEAAAGGVGDEHHVQPKVVSITQSTEVGTCYRVDEIDRPRRLGPPPRDVAPSGRGSAVECGRLPRGRPGCIRVGRRASTSSPTAAPRTVPWAQRRSSRSGRRTRHHCATSASSRCSWHRRCGSSRPSSPPCSPMTSGGRTPSTPIAWPSRLADGMSAIARGQTWPIRWRPTGCSPPCPPDVTEAAPEALSLLRVGRGDRRRPVDGLVRHHRTRTSTPSLPLVCESCWAQTGSRLDPDPWPVTGMVAR